MSEHKASVNWSRTSADFHYSSYNREHKISFENGVQIEASSAPAFLGKPEFIDPEEMFVAAYASCHMLTFLAIAAKKRLVVESYRDSAVGYLEKNDDGKLAITRIQLFPVVVFSGAALSASELAHIHERSHEECFIANSTKVMGSVHPQA